MTDWLTLLASVVGGTMPLAGLLLTLHDRNIKTRSRAEDRVEKLRRRDEKLHNRRERRLHARLDHLDVCVDETKQLVSDMRERVGKLEGQRDARMVRAPEP